MGNITQMHHARAGIVTPQMKRVAQREKVDPEFVRREVAEGRAVIPANIHHLRTGLDPMGISTHFSCKVNVNFGTSPVTKSLERIETYSLLKDFLTLMIQKDFVDFFHVRDTRTLAKLIKTLAEHTGQILVERNLSSDLGVAINTLRNHLGFLIDTGIVSTARAYSSSFARSARLPEKFFFLDPGLRNSLAGFLPDALGRLTETAVFMHLKLYLERALPGAELSYWRKRDEEVDIILSLGKRVIPIEIHKGRDTGIAGIKAFGQKYSASSGMLISERASESPGIISCPPHLFLLMGSSK